MPRAERDTCDAIAKPLRERSPRPGESPGSGGIRNKDDSNKTRSASGLFDARHSVVDPEFAPRHVCRHEAGRHTFDGTIKHALEPGLEVCPVLYVLADDFEIVSTRHFFQ